MNKIWNFIKKHFLTKKFLTFGIIGVANTGIHMLVYYIFYNQLVIGPFWSNTLAFISASIFSYFANAILTFKPNKKSTVQFSIVMVVYLARLLISSSLTSLFDMIFINWFKINYDASSLLALLAPLLASALLIPIAYFALDWVFKKTDSSEEK
ncbi:GtrA family protein [Mycoplasmatota bacterium WC30]